MDGTGRWRGWGFIVNGPSVRQLLISTRTEVASSQLSEGRNNTPANNREIKWVPVLGAVVQPERALMENLHLSLSLSLSIYICEIIIQIIIPILFKSTQNLASF